jgi:hypothetical protein
MTAPQPHDGLDPGPGVEAEAASEDVVEQLRAATDEAEAADPPLGDEPDPEADPADVAEQRHELPPDEEYPRG